MIIENWGPLTGLFSAIWELLKALGVPVMAFLRNLFDFSPMQMITDAWGGVVTFFEPIFTTLQSAVQSTRDILRTLFDFFPMEMLTSAWGGVVGFFEPIWMALQTSVQRVRGFFTSLFEWSPLEQIAQYWQPIGEVFSALWGVVLALSAPVVDFLHSLFEWKPLDQIIESWGPITEWFGELWQKLQTVIAPIKELFDGGFAGLIANVTGKVETLTEAQRQTNAEGKGELAPAFFAASPAPGNGTLQSGSLPQTSSALIQQSAANNRTQLEGGLTVRFENAPAGLRTDQPQTNQPGLAVSSRIGYRSLSMGGSQ